MNWPIFVIWLDERRISNDFGYVLHSKSSARVTRSAVKKSNVNTRQMIRVERSHFHLTWLGIFMQNRQTSARAINHFGAVAHSDKASTGKNDFSSLRSRQRGNFRRRKDEPNRVYDTRTKAFPAAVLTEPGTLQFPALITSCRGATFRPFYRTLIYLSEKS